MTPALRTSQSSVTLGLKTCVSGGYRQMWVFNLWMLYLGGHSDQEPLGSGWSNPVGTRKLCLEI